MSSRMFEDFLDQLSANGQLQEELWDMADEEGRVGMDEVARFAADRGYEFQVDDISDELSDEQLEAVTGGVDTLFHKVTISLTDTSLSAEFLKLDQYDGSLFLKFY